MMRLRIPISQPTDRPLRVLIYARYSTEEQHPSSIEDQVQYCKEFLKSNGITDASSEEISDREMSGELVSRPGINEVRKGIAIRKWDLVVVEDSSRLFRHPTACGELIETAADRGIRVFCLNDDVDTSEEDWEDPLHEAMSHHARSNRYTAKRIKRKMDGLWRIGAAVGPCRPGYRRRSTKSATQHEPEQGPFYDEIDSQWAPTIVEAYRRIADKEPAGLVAEWLTERGLPKSNNAQTEVWTDKGVLALIHSTIYRGLDVYRRTIVKKHFGSGQHLQMR